MFLSPSVVTDQDRVKEFNFKLMCYFSLPEDVSKGKKNVERKKTHVRDSQRYCAVNLSALELLLCHCFYFTGSCFRVCFCSQSPVAAF